MADVRDEYRRTGTAPSGRKCVYRRLNGFEIADVLDGLPQFDAPQGEAKSDADLTKEHRASLYEQFKRTCVFASIDPRLSFDRSEPEAIHPEELGPDLVWLYTEIQKFTNTVGVKAEQAKSFREESGQRESALRNGRGSRRKAVHADAGVRV